jgi:hypothetical protein
MRVVCADPELAAAAPRSDARCATSVDENDRERQTRGSLCTMARR